MKKLLITLLLCALVIPATGLAASVDAPLVEVEPITAPGDYAGPTPAPATMEAWTLLEQAFGAEDLGVAVDLALKAAQTAPEDVEVLLNAGYLIYIWDMNLDYLAECEQILRMALPIAKDENREITLRLLTETMVYDGRDEEALALIQAEIALNPANEGLQMTLANVLYYAGDNQAALEALEALAEDSPQYLEALTLRASILLEEYKFSDALDAYKQIERGWPDYLDGLYGQYAVYFASGEFSRAVRTADKLLMYSEDDSLWLRRARMRQWQMHDPETALSEAEALLRSDPTLADAVLVQVSALLSLERYEEAEAAAKTLTDTLPEFAALLNSIVMLNRAEWDAAREVLAKLCEDYPDWYTAWNYLAMSYMEGERNLPAVVDALKRSLATENGQYDYVTYLVLGDYYLALGQPLDAALAYWKSDSLTIDDPGMLYNLALAFAQAGRLEEYEFAVTEMERRYPGWYETMLSRVLLEDSLGNPQAALDAYLLFKAKFPFPAKRLVGLEGALTAYAGQEGGSQLIAQWMESEGKQDDAGAWNDYGLALMKEGSIAEARGAFDKGFALLPEDPAIYMERQTRGSLFASLASLEVIEGNLDAALAALEQSIAMGIPPSSFRISTDFAAIKDEPAFQALLNPETFEGEFDFEQSVKLPE